MIRAILSILLFSISLLAFSQVNDAGLYADISIEKKINQSFALEYTNSNRFNENISEYGTLINEISLKYKFTKRSRLVFAYRQSLKRQLNNMYEPRGRFSVDFTQGFELWDIDLDIRLKFQTQQANVIFYDFDSDSQNTFRPRIKLKYKIQSIEPYISFESFHPVWHSGDQPLSKLRGSVGVEYSFNNNHSVDCGYMIQREYFERNPITDYVVKIGYKFRF